MPRPSSLTRRELIALAGVGAGILILGEGVLASEAMSGPASLARRLVGIIRFNRGRRHGKPEGGGIGALRRRRSRFSRGSRRFRGKGFHELGGSSVEPAPREQGPSPR